MGGLLGLFLNPWALAGAGLLASVPIIIHLINRMRFRRVRWAAMEFLLAAQKRMKRKMIIEQLLLLASRVLLILLIGLLLSRWLLNGSPPLPPEDWILHEVVLDDSASMADVAKDAGSGSDSFTIAKEGIRSLAESALVAKTPTRIRLRRASEPGTVLFDEQMGDDSFGSLTTILEGAKLRPYKVDLAEALEKAKGELVGQYPELKTRKHLHLFSDMRKGDWADGKLRTNLTPADGVLWRVHDCALPGRNEENRPDYHGNLAVLALGSESRLALEGQPLECWAKVANFGSQARSAFLAVELNGKRDPSASRQVESLPPGQVVEIRFRVIPPPAPGRESGVNEARPSQGEGKDPVKEGLARRARGTTLAVRAILENDSGEGLFCDNMRDMVLEVRDRVPILVVDGTILPGASTSSDSLYFGAALNPQLFDPLFVEPADLEKQDLPSFALVVLLNVGELVEPSVAKLGEYVKSGGGLAWFAGDRTVPAFCNKLFDQDGLFPILLAGQPSPPLSDKDREELRRDDSPKVVFPDPSSPVVAGLLPFRPVFRHLRMERHWPSIETSRWTDQVETLLALPSKGWQIAGQREALKREILDILALDKAPFTSPSLAPVLGTLENEVSKARSKIATLGQFEIVAALEDLLRIQSPGDGNRPGIVVWDRPELRETQARLRAAIRKIQQGDPLLVSRPLGRGSVLAFLSSAGPSSSRSSLTGEAPGIWNEWANGFLSATFPILVQDSLFFLLRQQSDARGLAYSPNQIAEIGAFPSPVLVESFYFPQKANNPAAGTGVLASTKVSQVAAKLLQGQGGAPAGFWSLQIEPQENPGLLTFALKPEATAAQQIRGGLTFNVDTHESDLERASREEVDPRGDKSGQGSSVSEDWFTLDSAGAKSEVSKTMALSTRPLDASETPWLIVALLALLLLEQFLAWRCSHLEPGGANLSTKGVV